jgi:hypothetical protein
MTTRAEDRGLGTTSSDTLRVVISEDQPTVGVSGALGLSPTLSVGLYAINTTAYASSLVVKPNFGVVYSITGYNSKASGQFIQLHDSGTLPADGAVPKIIFYVPAQSNFSLDLSIYGRNFNLGIVVCNSSTGPVKTLGSADCWFDVLYK